MTGYVATYTVKDASQLIDISVSTVRKYSLLLESKDYRISRDESNARVFYEPDILAMRRLKDGTASGRTLDTVAQEIADAKTDTEVIKGSPPAHNDAMAIRELTQTVAALTDKIDAMAVEQEETRRAFQMAVRTLEGKTEEVELLEHEVEEAKSAGLFARIFGKRGNK